MGTPERAPAGFRTVDIEAAKIRWPLTDPKFLQFSGSGADGAAESRMRAIIRNIATDVRYSPPTTTPIISEGALTRPPPDTTLWTGRIGAGTFPAPSSSADLTEWRGTRNRWVRRHMGNFRAQGPLLAEIANGRSSVKPAIFYISRANTGGQAERALALIGNRSSTLGDALDAAYRRTRSPSGAGREMIARSFMTAAAGARVGRGVLDVPETPDSEAGRYTVETGQSPWEVRLVIAASVLSMRGQPQPVTGLVRLDDATASALAEPVFAYEGFALTGIAITQFGAGTGPRGVYEVSALLVFRDATGRQTLASLVLRFAIADDHIVLEDAEAVPLAAASPAATVWYVPTRVLVASNLAAADGPGLAKLAAQHTVNSATAAPDPVDYYVFAFINDRLAPDAAVELRISAGAEGIVGFSGRPVMLNFNGWQVRVHRATFVLGALPAFHFKVVYRRGTSIATDDASTPVLLRAAASVPGGASATAAPGITPPGGKRAIHNIIGNAR